MRRHIAYLKYVLRHKWFVLLAGIKFNAPLWRLIIHDWHKFLPSEWFPYAYTFYNTDGSKRYEENAVFEYAWLIHQKRGKHHWQHWMLTFDRGETKCLDMPTCFILEMLADWYGAGRAITGRWEAHEWYEKNKANIQVSPVTRAILECNLREYLNREQEKKDLEAKRKRILGY